MTWNELASAIRSAPLPVRRGDGERGNGERGDGGRTTTSGRGTGSRIVGVDGWSGAGKSTFARGLAARLDAPCISTDDLVVGWDGLAGSIGLLVTCILAPLRVGEPARWNRFDWERLAPGPDVTCLSAPIVVVEGCAIGTAWPRSYLSYLIWIDTPAPERRRRLENRRDWPAYEPHVDHWADQERALRKGVGTIDHADLVVHGALADSFLAELEEGRSDAG